MKQAPVITKGDLVEYGNFKDEASIPEGHEKLVAFASDIVMYAVRNNYNPSSDSHVLAVKKAICSQVLYWIETGTNPVNDTNASSFTLGEISMSMSTPQGTENGSSPTLCPLALMYLKGEYLLYRGMKHGRF